MTPSIACQHFAAECRALLEQWWALRPAAPVDPCSTEHAATWAAAVLGQPLPPPSWDAGFLAQPWKDASGQTRAVYGRYVLACQLQASLRHAPPGAPAIPFSGGPRAHAPSATSALRATLRHDMTCPTQPLVLRVWDAWNLWLLGQASHQPDWAGAAVDHLNNLLHQHQQPAGHWHPLTAQTNLDTFNYDELTTLHALGAVAAHSADAALRAGAGRMAAYHCANTQPDNTTQQPWAMGVFAWFSNTLPLAQQQLHTVRTGADRSGLMLALLADAVALLHCADATVMISA